MIYEKTLERAFIEMDQIKSLLNTAITNQNTILRRLDSEIFPTSSKLRNPFTDSFSSSLSLNALRKRKANDLRKSVSETSSPPPALEVNSFGRKTSRKSKIESEVNASVMPKLSVANNENINSRNRNDDDGNLKDNEGIV